MRNNKKGILIKSQVCPIHEAHPTLVIDSDRFTIRCCCVFFTRKYISKLEANLKGLSFETILNNWENDLLTNESQAGLIPDQTIAVNTMLTIKKVQEQ